MDRKIIVCDLCKHKKVLSSVINGFPCKYCLDEKYSHKIGETAQALNETYLPPKYITKPDLGGINKVKNEAFHTIALLFRLIEKLEDERINEMFNGR